MVISAVTTLPEVLPRTDAGESRPTTTRQKDCEPHPFDRASGRLQAGPRSADEVRPLGLGEESPIRRVSSLANGVGDTVWASAGRGAWLVGPIAAGGAVLTGTRPFKGAIHRCVKESLSLRSGIWP